MATSDSEQTGFILSMLIPAGFAAWWYLRYTGLIPDFWKKKGTGDAAVEDPAPVDNPAGGDITGDAENPALPQAQVSNADEPRDS